MALFDPNKQKKIEATLEDVQFKKEDSVHSLKNPSPNEIFRVKGNSIEDIFEVTTSKQPDANGDEKLYIIQPDDMNELSKMVEILSPCQRVLLAFCMTTFQKFFIWPVGIEANGRVMEVHLSQRKCVELAQQQWIKTRWDHGTKRRFAMIPINQEGFPESVEWPDEDIATTINKAFTEDQIISNMDHPVLKAAMAKRVS